MNADHCSSGRRSHSHAPADAAVDPVCGMTVSKQTPHRTRHDGTDYFFCSNGCRTKFEAHPGKFTNPDRAQNGGPEHPHHRPPLRGTRGVLQGREGLDHAG